MSTKKKNEQKGEQVVQAVNKTEKFFSENKNTFLYALIGIVAVCLIFFAVQQFFIKPAKEEAKAQTFVAEQYFRSDDFEKALNGDGNTLGFAQIIDEYGKKGGISVYMYAGICELNLGNYQSAINYLNKYKTDDQILQARAFCCLGDAYVGLGDNNKALTYYKNAANHSDNILAATYLLKAGLVYEELGNTTEALKMYQTIKDKYPQTFEGYEIDKYISRINISK